MRHLLYCILMSSGSSGIVHCGCDEPNRLPFLLATAACFQLCASLVLAGPVKQGAPSARTSTSAVSSSSSIVSLGATLAPLSQSASKDAVTKPGLNSTNVIPIDLGQPVVGGTVFSTGTDDILLKVLTPDGMPYPSETVDVFVGGQRIRMPNPNVSAWTDEICVVSPGPARSLTSNKQYGRVINLGKLPPGEIVFAIRTPDGNFFKTGEASRNPDGRPHAIVKTFRSGVMQVWFEDQAGPRSATSDLDANDAVFELSGGVSDNNAVAELTKVIKEQKGEAQQQAMDALRQINPKAFALARAEP
jgi:hypothetical protein